MEGAHVAICFCFFTNSIGMLCIHRRPRYDRRPQLSVRSPLLPLTTLSRRTPAHLFFVAGPAPRAPWPTNVSCNVESVHVEIPTNFLTRLHTAIAAFEDDPAIPENIAEPVPEEADFLLRSELSPEQGVFFGDLITLKAPFSANTYIWKKDGKVLDAHGPELAIKNFSPDDVGEYIVEDELRHSSASIVLGLPSSCCFRHYSWFFNGWFSLGFPKNLFI